VVVDDFDALRTLLGPHNADTVLAIDADAVLPGAIVGERLERVARNKRQITNAGAAN